MPSRPCLVEAGQEEVAMSRSARGLFISLLVLGITVFALACSGGGDDSSSSGGSTGDALNPGTTDNSSASVDADLRLPGGDPITLVEW